MLISKEVMVKWNGFTRKHYEEKGYIWTKQNDEFEVKVEDLPFCSTAKVLVDCDYKKDGCKGIHNKQYRQYTEDKERGYGNCCTNRKCGAAKTKEILLDKYGVDNTSKLESYKQELRERLKTPFQLFVECAKEKNLILLTVKEEYKNNKSKIRFICLKHKEFGEQEMNAYHFLNKKNCCKYEGYESKGLSRRLDGQIVFDAFIERGLIPKFKPEDYINNSVPMPYLCPEHLDKGIQFKQYANLYANKHKCYYCGNESTKEKLRIDEDIVFNYFIQRGLTIVNSEEYKGKDKNIKYYCNKHPEYIQEVSYAGLKNTKEPCDYCRAEKSLTKLNKRLRSSLTQWQKKSKELCGNKCIFTNSINFDIHHLKSYNEIIKEALLELGYEIKTQYSGKEFINIKNKVVELHYKYPGVCIHNSIHVLFHQLYSKESTIEDFEKFKHRYLLGEFDEIFKGIC